MVTSSPPLPTSHHHQTRNRTPIPTRREPELADRETLGFFLPFVVRSSDQASRRPFQGLGEAGGGQAPDSRSGAGGAHAACVRAGLARWDDPEPEHDRQDVAQGLRLAEAVLPHVGEREDGGPDQGGGIHQSRWPQRDQNGPHSEHPSGQSVPSVPFAQSRPKKEEGRKTIWLVLTDSFSSLFFWQRSAFS